MAARAGARVAALVLGARGGERLARTLDGVTWADERVVLDPAGRLGGAALPAGVVRRAGADPALAGDADWLLLVAEGEVVPAALCDAVRAAVAGAAGGPAAWRIGLDVALPGGTLRPARAPVRLAARGARLRVRRDGEVALASGGGRIGRLAPRLAVAWPGDLATAVVDLDADAAVLAALLDADARRPTARGLVGGGLAAAAAALAGRAPRVPFAARWTAAVLAGYRVAVAQAKLWELRRRRPEAVA